MSIGWLQGIRFEGGPDVGGRAGALSVSTSRDTGPRLAVSLTRDSSTIPSFSGNSENVVVAAVAAVQIAQNPDGSRRCCTRREGHARELTWIRAGPALSWSARNGEGRSTMRHIMVATDGSSSADRAVDFAAQLAKATGAALHILTIAGGLSGDATRRLAQAEGHVGDSLEALSIQALMQARGRVQRVGMVAIDIETGWGDRRKQSSRSPSARARM